MISQSLPGKEYTADGSHLLYEIREEEKGRNLLKKQYLCWIGLVCEM